MLNFTTELNLIFGAVIISSCIVSLLYVMKFSFGVSAYILFLDKINTKTIIYLIYRFSKIVVCFHFTVKIFE